MKAATSTVLLIGLAACGTPGTSDQVHNTTPCIPDSIRAWLTPDTGYISAVSIDTVLGGVGCTTSFLNLTRGTVRVQGYHVLPEESGERMPLALYQHWGEGDKTEFWEEAKELAQQGWQCVLLDATWFEESFPNRSYVRNGWNMVRDGVLDWRTVLDYLEQDPSFAIDTTRIVFVGHSYGGQIAGILAGVEPRITRFVIMAGAPSTAEATRTSTVPDIMHWRDSVPAEVANYVEHMTPLDAEKFVGCGITPILFQWARHDEFDIDSLDAVRYQQAGEIRPSKLIFYDATHSLDVPEAKRDRLEWIMATNK
ncbi:MAG: alpha/beta fold hydrolase [Flavobacteriales bacterium]